MSFLMQQSDSSTADAARRKRMHTNNSSPLDSDWRRSRSGAVDAAEQQFRSEEIASQNEIVTKSLKALPEEVRQQIELQNGEWIEIGKLRKGLAADETLIEKSSHATVEFVARKNDRRSESKVSAR